MSNLATFPTERTREGRARAERRRWAEQFWLSRPSPAQVRAFHAGLAMPRAASQEQIAFKLAAHRDHVAAFHRGRSLRRRLRRGYLDTANPRPWAGVRWQPVRSLRLARVLQPLGALLWPPKTTTSPPSP